MEQCRARRKGNHRKQNIHSGTSPGPEKICTSSPPPPGQHSSPFIVHNSIRGHAHHHTAPRPLVSARAHQFTALHSTSQRFTAPADALTRPHASYQHTSGRTSITATAATSYRPRNPPRWTYRSCICATAAVPPPSCHHRVPPIRVWRWIRGVHRRRDLHLYGATRHTILKSHDSAHQSQRRGVSYALYCHPRAPIPTPPTLPI